MRSGQRDGEAAILREGRIVRIERRPLKGVFDQLSEAEAWARELAEHDGVDACVEEAPGVYRLL